MTGQDRGGVTTLTVASSGRKSFFSLEMTPDGVSLRLEAASSRISGLTARIFDLALSVPWLNFPFDYTSGPRALQNHLTELDSLTVEIGFDLLACLVRGDREPAVKVERGSQGTVVFSGVADHVPWSVRTAFEAGIRGDVILKFLYPRTFVLSDMPWATVPGILTESVQNREISIPLARMVLKPLMAGLGFKLPLMTRTIFTKAEVSADKVAFRFAVADANSLPNAISDTENESLEKSRVDLREPSGILAKLASSSKDAAGIMEFVESATGSPVLWPEILARSLELGNERPELVSTQLAAVLTGSENPGWLDNEELFRVCRRLLSSAQNEGCREEVERCAVLISRVVDRFAPPDSLSILDEIRTAGFETREVLEAAAVTFDRLGRHLDASTTRLRALAMVPARSAPDAVRALVDRMDVNGFVDQTAQWLLELLNLGARGRFGSASDAIHRTAVVLLASRNAMSGREDAWKMLQEALVSKPDDPEILELLLTLSGESHEIAEAISLFQTAAENTAGRAKCDLLTMAGRALNERFGLKRRAVELLEQAFEADPECRETAELLDRLYDVLQKPGNRAELAWKRLSVCSDSPERIRLLSITMNSAMEAGLTRKSAVAARELLRLDPANPVFLETAERVFAASGEVDGLREVREALEDLGLSNPSSPPPDKSEIDAALAAGDLERAIGLLKEDLGPSREKSSRSSPDCRDDCERMIQLADLCLLAGHIDEATGYFKACAGLEPEIAMASALRAVTLQESSVAGRIMDAVREISGRPLATEAKIRIANLLVDTAGSVFESNPGTAGEMLETAVFLQPENTSALMALAALYESLGRHAEAAAVSGST